MRIETETSPQTMEQLRMIWQQVNHHDMNTNTGEPAWLSAMAVMADSNREPSPEEVFRYGFMIGKASEAGNQRSRWVKAWEQMNREQGNENSTVR